MLTKMAKLPEIESAEYRNMREALRKRTKELDVLEILNRPGLPAAPPRLDASAVPYFVVSNAFGEPSFPEYSICDLGPMGPFTVCKESGQARYLPLTAMTPFLRRKSCICGVLA